MENRSLFQSSGQAYSLVHEPPDIELDDHVMDILFSPNSNVLALG
jgi:hypothetical protein